MNVADSESGSFAFTLSDSSDGLGSGPFGTVTISDLGGGTAQFAISVAPNYDLDTGAHYILTFSLVSGGTVDASSISNPIFSTATGTFSNPPFGSFNVEISSTCTQGNPTCRAANGQAFTFDVLNFAGLISATSQYASQDVWFAADIYSIATGKTGAVGATYTACEGPNCGGGGGGNPPAVPLPPALVLFGSGLLGMTWLGRRRRRTA